MMDAVATKTAAVAEAAHRRTRKVVASGPSTAKELVGPIPSHVGSEDVPVVCARITVGDEVLEMFTAVVRFDTPTR